MSTDPILSVRNLKTYFQSNRHQVKALDGLSMDVRSGTITAIVGGSGSGKSVLALSILDLISAPGKIVAGEILLNGKDLTSLGEKALRTVRGRELALIFQDPSGSLNPVRRIKHHLFEAAGTGCRARRKALEQFRETLIRVGLKEPDRILNSYPFELSGGMCQRVMVAMGLVSGAGLIIADEPTSSLDLTTQAVILKEFKRLRDQGLTIVLITHDLGVVAQTADYVYVIHNGRMVENGPVAEVFLAPRHEYSIRLMAAAIEAPASSSPVSVTA